MSIDWLISIPTEDGYTIFESDATVEYTVTHQMGEDIVEVDAFEIIASRRIPGSPTGWEDRATPARFDEHAKHAWEKLLFFHVKEALENNPDFIYHVLDGQDLPYQDPNAEHRLGAFALL